MLEALKSLALIYGGLGTAFTLAYLIAKYCFPEKE